MLKSPHKFSLIALGSILCAGVLPAQEAGWGAGLNLRAGSVVGSTNGQIKHQMLGFGVEVRYALTAKSAFFGELGLLYFAGEDFVKPLPAQGYVSYTGVLGNLSSSTSVDRRKNDLQGVSFRAGYRSAILDSGWNWQAGLSLERLKSRQEVSGVLRPLGSTATTGYEGLSVTPESAKIAPGVFAGVLTTFGEGFTFQANVINVGYSQVNWVPYTYTAQPAHAETSNKRKTAFELAIGFKF